MAALSYEEIKKQVQADREQKSKQVAEGISYEEIKKGVQGKRLLDSAQGYTLDRDNENLYIEIQNILSNWQDAQTVQKTIDALPKMTKRMENYKNYLADYYTGQDQKEQLEQVEKQIADYSHLSALLQGQASFYSKYKSADEYERAKKASGYYKGYENSSYEEIQNSLSELKKQKSFYTVKGYDKEAEDIGEKIQWLENFYNNGYAQAPIEWRKERYKQNQEEIGRLAEEIENLGGTVENSSPLPAPSRSQIPNQRDFGNYIEQENTRTEKIKKLIAQRNALIAENNRYDRGQGQLDAMYDEITAIKQNDDYEEFSKVKKDIKDEIYLFINDEKYREKMAANRTEQGETEYDMLKKYGLLEGKDGIDEIGVYNYYYAQKGKQAANEFLHKLDGVLDQRLRYAEKQEIIDAVSQEGFKGAAASIVWSGRSIFEKIIGGVTAFLDDSTRQISGQEIDPDSEAHRLLNRANDTRAIISEKIVENTSWEFLGENVMAQVYNALMSAGDSIIGAVTMGKLYTIAMGAGAAADKSAELYEKGASNSQIFWGGLSAGVAETVFEKVSLENLIKPKNPDSFFKIVLEVFKQAGIEGSEEIATEIANTITDSIIMGSQSDLSLAVKAYQKDGLSYEEAYKKALLDKVVDISWAGIAGMMAGGMSSSILTGYSSVKNIQIGNTIKKSGKSNALIDFAMQNYGKDTEAYKTAERLSKNAKNSALAIGSLYMIMEQQNQTDFAKASDVSAKDIQPMLEKNGMEAPQASLMAKSIAKDMKGWKLSTKERQQLTNTPAAKPVYDSVRADVKKKKEAVQTKERMLGAIVDVKAEISGNDSAQNLDNPGRPEYTNNIENGNIATGEKAGTAGQTAAGNLGLAQTAPGMAGQERNIGNAVHAERGEEYARTAEFRELQEASRGMSDEISALYHAGERTLDEGLRRRISTVLKRQLDVSGSSIGNGDGILTLTAKGNTFHLHQQVDGALFHDVFEIAKSYLKNGELVDLHGIQTTEDGIGYEDCDNYLSDDGFSGFSITPDGDLISVFNASGKKGFLNAVAPLVKERAKKLDCYNSRTQPLLEIYEKTFGFKAASVMEYNIEYDHDNIAANHDNPQVAFMVNTEQEVETKHFDKDQYEAAKAYRDQYVEQAAQESAFFMSGEPVITERSAENPEPDMIADMVYAVRGETRLTEDQRVIRRIGKRLGWTVEFGDVRTANGAYADGKIDKANKVITISTENKRPIAFIFKHELAHFLEINSVRYKTFANTIIGSLVFENWMHYKGYKSIIEYNTAVVEEYSRAGEERFGEYEANLEIVADFVGENLFGNNQQVLGKLLSVMEPKQRRTFAEWIKDLFKRLKNAFSRNGDRTIRSEIEKLEKLFMETYKAVNIKYNTEENKRQQELLQDNIKFSLMNDRPFSENVNEVLNMSDAEAKHNAEQGNFIRVMKDTPEIILKNVEDAKNIEIIISFYSLYLAGREKGILEGHYHNLGKEILYQIPEYIANPDAIVRMKSDRLNLLAQIRTPKGKNGIISVELNTVKDINNKYKNYNLIVSVFSAKDNYTENNIRKNGVKVEYKREDLPQVNSQLYKWLAIVNDKSSNDNVAQDAQSVNSIIFKNAKNDTKEAQYSIAESDRREIKKTVLRGKYDYSKSFAKQIEDYKNGKIPKRDTLIVGKTPEIFQRIGLNKLPMTINQTHVDYAINGTKDYDHFLGEEGLKQLPEALKHPVAVISSKTKNGTSLVAILDIRQNGKQIVVPVVIDGFGTQNGIRIDSNALTSMYGKDFSISKVLYNALNDEANGKAFSVYYVDTDKAATLFRGARVLMPKVPDTNANGFIHNITEQDSPVKPKFSNQTETQQFKRWFGNSKVVNKDGTPKIVYYGTGENFTVFDKSRIENNFMQREGGFYFTEKKQSARNYAALNSGNAVVMAYLRIQNPYVVELSSGIDNADYFDDHRLNILQEADIAENDGIIVTGGDNGTIYVVFEANQIKSVTDNIGTFDGENPDIRYSVPKEETTGEEDLDNWIWPGYNENNIGNAVHAERGEGYAKTAEFRELQEESRGMPDEISALYHSGERTLDEGLRGDIARVFQTQINAAGNGAGNGDGILTLTAKGNTFHLHQQVDGALFHDVFEIAKSYLKNGELVDLHGIQTTEDGIGYEDCDNYLSDDGLSGFSITPDGDLISIFNASGKKGFLNAIAPIVKERAKTLDCYNSPTQPLLEIYEKTFGFKAASVMDYNMEYDHDNIAVNHDNSQVAFMVNTEQEVETKHFDKDQYEEAKAYRDQYVEQAAQESAFFMSGEPVITERSAENPEPDMIADMVYAVRGETRLTEDQRVIRRIGKRLGWTVEFGDVRTANGAYADGKIDKANKVITISTENKRPIAFIFKHELAHRGEGTKQYTELVKAISQTKQYENWLQKNTGMKSTVERMEAAWNEEIRQRYDTAGESLSVAEARAEIMADFMGDMLFADENGMNRLLQELEPPKRRSLLQWIKGALSYIRSKLGNADSRLTAELERLEQQYARMLKESEIIKLKDGTQYSVAKSFSEQVDEVLEGKHNARLDLYIAETPKNLKNLNFSEGPLLMRNGKITEILKKHDDMSINIIKKLPEMINNPLLILKSKTHPTQSVVLITNVLTAKGNLIIPIWINQEGNYMDVDLGEQVLRTNFIASAYGRNVQELLKYAIGNEGFLYEDSKQKEEIRELFARNGLQLPTPLKLSDSDIIISLDIDSVNSNSMQKKPNDTPKIQYSLIGKREDGVEIYKTSESVTSLPYKERKRILLDTIKSEYKGRVAKFYKNGKVYYAVLNENTARKGVYGDKKSDKTGYKAKINIGADGNYFELVENSKYINSAAEQGKKTNTDIHDFVERWDYYEKTVQADGKLFDVLINVADKGANQYVYDVTLKEQKNSEFPSSSKTTLSQGNTAINSINQDELSVNSIIFKNAKNDTKETQDYQSDETDIIRAKDGIKYSIAKSYKQQVDDVLNNNYDKNNHVYMGNTPSKIVQVLGLPDLPMLATNNHIYSMSVSEQQAKQEGRYKKGRHYHDLGAIVKELPKLLNEPVLLIKSNTRADDATVVAVTSAVDKNGFPVMAVIKPNGKGYYCNVEIDANIMLSGYGKENIQNYVQTAGEEGRILYADKKSNQQHNIPGVQFPNNIMTADYNNSLAQYRQSVNSIIFKNAKNDTKETQDSIAKSERRTIKDLIEKLNEGDSIAIEAINENNAIKNSLEKMEEIPETYRINTPERELKREEIVKKLMALGSYTGVDTQGKELYNGNVDQGYRIDLVVGLPAAGKSSVLVNPLSKQNHARVIDSDMAKEMIPEFNNGIGASAVHEESKNIVKQVIVEAIANGDNIVYPIVGGGDVNKLIKKISAFRNNGYTAYLHLNELPLHKAMARMLNRYLETGRFIPPQIVYEYQNTPIENFEAIIKTEGLVDGYSHYSNDVARGETPILKKHKNIQLLPGRGQRRNGMAQQGREGIEDEERNGKADLTKSASFVPGEPVITERSAENPEPDIIADTVYDMPGQKQLTEDQRVIRRIGNRLGWTIEFGKVQTANGAYVDGKIDKANQVITISTENKRPIAFIFKHELAHRGEGTEQYTELIKAISQTKQYENWLQKNTGMKSTVERMEAAWNEEIRQRYDTAGESLSVAEARAEIMADFMGDMLFADEGGMNRLLQELEPPKRRSLLQWIKDALNYIRSKLGNADSRVAVELEQLESKYVQLLKNTELQQGSSRGQYSFGGVYAKSADRLKLETAKQMEKYGGATPEEIRQETGWYRGYDGLWRFEIDDSKMRIKEAKLVSGNTTLGDILDHPDLLAAYPQLKDVVVTAHRSSLMNDADGWYSEEAKELVLNSKYLESAAVKKEIEILKMTEDYREYQENLKKAAKKKDFMRVNLLLKFAQLQNTPEYQDYVKRRTEAKNANSEELCDQIEFEWQMSERGREYQNLKTRFYELSKDTTIQEITAEFHTTAVGIRYLQLLRNIENADITNNEATRKALIHEIQHAVQYIEGFANGSSPEFWKSYKNKMTETEKKLHQEAELAVKQLYAKLKEEFGPEAEEATSEIIMLETRLRTENLTEQEFSRLTEHMEEIRGKAELAGYGELQKETEKAVQKLKAVEDSVKTRQKRKSGDLYLSTAGEIEARDAARRLELSAKERKRSRPDIDRPDVVFADEGLEKKAVKTKRQGNIDTEEAERYNENIDFEEAEKRLTESSSQLSETFYEELEQALNGESGENNSWNKGVKDKYKTIDDLINGLRETTNGKGVTRNFESFGGYTQTLLDFDALNLTNVKNIQTKYGFGKVGILSDGTKVVARQGSTTGGATLEIKVSNSKVYKIRY